MQKNKLLTGLGAVALSVSMALGTAGAAQAAPPQVQAAQVQAPKASLAPTAISAPATLDNVAGTFTGTFTPTNFQVVNGALQAVGTLTNAVFTPTGGTPTPVGTGTIPTTLDVVGAAANNACSILSLDLGPLNLDLLGLVVDLSEVNLDITAVPGPGNLLGNLLCAVAGLLDGNNLGAGLSNLLNRLLGLLG